MLSSAPRLVGGGLVEAGTVHGEVAHEERHRAVGEAGVRAHGADALPACQLVDMLQQRLFQGGALGPGVAGDGLAPALELQAAVVAVGLQGLEQGLRHRAIGMAAVERALEAERDLSLIHI